MAFRSWLKLLAATVTAAAVIGAGQLGIAYGLGVVQLDQTLEITQRDLWTAQLAWITWITATAAALGAVVATALRPRWSPRPVSSGGALAMGLAAGIGALAVLPLTMQPAREAHVTGVQPALIVGICVVLGAAIGIFAAFAAAARAAARWSLATLSVIVWAVALLTLAPSLKPGGTPTAVRLGVLEGSLIPTAVAEHTPFVTMPAIALLAGLIVGWIARGRRMSTLTVALSGVAGPALLTLAYLIAGPGSVSGFTMSPYWAAMTASGAGVLGSVLATIIRTAPGTGPGSEPDAPSEIRPGTSPETEPPAVPEPEPAAGPKPEPAAGPKPEPASGRASLPRRDVPQQSAIAQAAAAAAMRPEDQLRPSDTGVFTVADRPQQVRDQASARPAVSSPFAAGNGTPFHQGGPTGAHAQISPAPSRDTTGAHAPVAAPHSPTGAHAQVPAPQSAARFTAPQAIPAQVAGLAPAQVTGPDAEPRFSGQHPVKSSGGQRRGWRTRRTEPEPPQPAAPSTETGSFNGFTPNHPGPRTGIDTAEHPRAAARGPLVAEPTAVDRHRPQPQPVGPPPSAPAPQNAVHGRSGTKEDEYVGWVNGLSGE